MHPSPRFKLSGIAAAVAICLGATSNAATRNWIDATGFWNVPGNWDTGVPVNGDDVIIDVAGVQTVTYSTGTTSINTLAVGSGANPGNNLTISGGALTVTGAYTNLGSTTVSSGSFTLNGPSSLATLSLSGGTLGGTGTVTVSGLTTWTGGTMTGAGITRLNGDVALSGNGARAISGGRTVNTTATTTWGGNTANNGNEIFIANATINNTGTWLDQNNFNLRMLNQGNPAVFNNTGTYTKTGTSVTDVSVTFNNTAPGVLNVNNGTLSLNGGGTNSSAVNVGASGVLQFGNNYNVAAGATTTNNGIVRLAFGTVSFDAAHAINGTGVLEIARGVRGGTGLVTVNQQTNWTDGGFAGAGTTITNAALNITGSEAKGINTGHTLNTVGTTTWGGNTSNNTNEISIANATINNTGTWLDQNNFNLRMLNQGNPAIFNNTGTYTKTGTSVTDVSVTFNNTAPGVLNVNNGTLSLNGGGTNSSAVNVGASGVLQFGNNYNVAAGATTTNNGIVRLAFGTVSFDAAHAINGTGVLEIARGVRGGTGLVTVNQQTNWTDGGFAGAGTTITNAALNITGSEAKGINTGHTLNTVGTTTWGGNTSNNTNEISIANATINNTGTWLDQNNFNLRMLNQGNPAIFNNTGTYTKTGTSVTDVSVTFNNTAPGVLNVNGGTLSLNGGGTNSSAVNVGPGGVLQFANNYTVAAGATTTNNGIVRLAFGTVSFDAAHAINGTGVLEIARGVRGGTGLVTVNQQTNWTDGGFAGAGTTITNAALNITGSEAKGINTGHTLNTVGTTTWGGNTSNNTNEISIANATINNTGTWLDQNNFNLRMLNQGNPAVFNNAGTYTKSGAATLTASTVFTNSGTLNANAGNMIVSNGVQGPTGTINIGTGGTLTLGPASSAGTLSHNGSGPASLNLGANTITVHSDYTNANFGTGDAFNRRANVATTGVGNRLIAAGDANQGLSGANIVNGNTTTPAIVIGNVRVGANTFTYDIANTGTNGPSLRGAIQTGVNGGNITDARLSGNGVTAGNWGPVATGGSLSRDVIVTVNTAGVFTPLAGQAVNILNNFDNTRSQLLTISSAAGAAAYRVAAPVVTGNLDFGNVLVGSMQERFVTVSNSALADGFSEGLNAAFGSITGTGASLLTGSGSLTNLAAGASDSTTLRVILNTSASGSVNASVEVVLASNGATTSGLGTLALPSQFLASLASITGQVGVLAQGSTTPTLVNAGNVRIGTGVGQVLTVSNVAVGPAEGLNASFGANTGNVANNGGTITSLPAGTANNTSMSVNLDTSVAGARSGTATVNYVSDGSFNSGVTTPVGSQAVSLQANVFRLAQGSAADPVNLGNFRVGNAVSGAINVTNTAAADGFSERLNANVTGTGGAVSGTTGSVALLNAGSSSNLINATIGSGVAGANSGTVTLAYQSDGTGTTGASAIGVGGQTVNVQATGWNVATGNATPTPVNLGNFHVGVASSASQNLAVANQAPAAFSEQLGIQSANATGPFTATNNLGAGRVNGGASAANAISVGLGAGGVAGANAGTVSIQYLSDGSAPGNSGFAASNSNLQNLSVNATGYRLATYDLGTLNFGNVLVGSGLTSRTLSVTNTQIADAFSEGLNARFGTLSNSGAGILSDISSAITNLLAGQSNSSNLRVQLNPTTQGGINGSIQVILESNGATTSGLGITALGTENIVITGTITGQAGVLAQGSTTPTLVNAGNVRIGTGVGQVLTVSNVAVGPAEGLNASFGANTGNVANNGGTITSLPAGTANNTSMSVNLDTSVAGARSGTATVNYVSDGSFNSGVTTPVGSEAVTLQANVFRLANPVVNTPSVTLAARVGDAAPSAGISITNSSPDTFTEGLKASVASTPAGFAGSGAIANLAAQGTDGSTLRVALNTGTAGTFSGNAALALESTGAGTTGAPDLALPGQNVAVSGKVYTPAVASVSPGALNFGIVHVGDAVADKAVTVANAAPVTALNDVLRGSIAAGGPFNATGTLGAGVAAGASDSTSLKVGLSTAVAGVFAGPATLGLLSHNDDMSDLPLPDVLVQLSAQVNNYANPVFVKTGGSGNLSRVGSVFTLDFGDLALGGSAASALGVLNDVFGPADLLDGAFDTSGVDDFLLAGFASFTGLDAGDLFSGLLASFDALVVGGYTDTVGLRARGYNASGFEEFFNLSLVLRADVGQPSTVPEPGSLALVALAIASALVFRRRARHTIARR